MKNDSTVDVVKGKEKKRSLSTLKEKLSFRENVIF
jgi:hypothetical protein